MDSIKKEVRKLLMAGLGAAAEGVEKGDALLEKFAEKGEDALKQSKIKNEELKRTVRENLQGEKDAASIIDAVRKMSAEQLAALKAHIEKCGQEQEEEGAEAAAEGAEADAEEPAEAEEPAAEEADAPEEDK